MMHMHMMMKQMMMKMRQMMMMKRECEETRDLSRIRLGLPRARVIISPLYCCCSPLENHTTTICRCQIYDITNIYVRLILLPPESMFLTEILC